jgi:hypothetical protein
LSANGVVIPVIVAKDTQRRLVQKQTLMVNFDVVWTRIGWNYWNKINGIKSEIWSTFCMPIFKTLLESSQSVAFYLKFYYINYYHNGVYIYSRFYVCSEAYLINQSRNFCFVFLISFSSKYCYCSFALNFNLVFMRIIRRKLETCREVYSFMVLYNNNNYYALVSMLGE